MFRIERKYCLIRPLDNSDFYLYLLDVGLSLSEGSSNLTKLLLSGCSLTNQTLRTLSEKAQGRLPCLVYLDLSSNEQLTTECLSSICAMTSSPGEIFSNLSQMHVEAKAAV